MASHRPRSYYVYSCEDENTKTFITFAKIYHINSPKAISQYHFSNSLKFDISEDLNFELSLTASEHENKHNRPDTIESRFEAAIIGQGGPNGNEQWNIFL